MSKPGEVLTDAKRIEQEIKEKREIELIGKIKEKYTGLNKKYEELRQISKELEIDYFYVKYLVKKAEALGIWFTDSELKEKIGNKEPNLQGEALTEEERNDIIRDLTRNGCTQKQIGEELGISKTSVGRIIKKLKEQGKWLTKEELEKIKALKEDKIFNNLSDKVKDLYGRHYTTSQIEKELRISRASVGKIIERLKKEGRWFTKEELEKIEAPKENEKQKAKQEEINRIKYLFSQGYINSEIAGMIERSHAYVKKVEEQLKAAGKWFSKEELEKIYELRNNRMNQNVETQLERGSVGFIKKVIVLYRKEKSLKEISEIMGCSATYIAILRKRCIEEGTWVSAEEDAELRRKIRQRTHKNRKKKTKPTEIKGNEKIQAKSEKGAGTATSKTNSKMANQLKTNKIPKKSKQKQKLIVALRKIRNLRSSVPEDDYMSFFSVIRSVAKQEDRKEYNGEEDVSIEGRQAFVESVLKLNGLGLKGFTENDLKMISDSFFMHPKLANKEIIKLIVLYSTEKKGWKSALKTVYELMQSLEGTPYYETLGDYAWWIKIKSNIPQMQELRKQGFGYGKIGEKFGLSSAEVKIAFEGDFVPEFN